MKKSSSITLFVVLAFLVPVMAYLGYNWYESRFQSLPYYGVKSDHRVEEFQLVNQDGKTRSLNKWDNKIVVADFFFTHCPSICPIMTANMKKVQEHFVGNNRILFQSFSVDPERDSSSVLKAYAGRFGVNNSNWDLLTGDKKLIYRMARNSFLVVATEGDGGETDFIHSEKLVLIDQQKRIRGFYDGTSDEETKRLIQDIKKLTK